MINNWDMGTADGSGTLYPIRSLLHTTLGTAWTSFATTGGGTAANGFNRLATTANVGFVNPSNIQVSVLPWRTNPAFRQALIVTSNRPLSTTFDYHITAGSAANNQGRARVQIPIGAANPSYLAPNTDIDGQTRYTATNPTALDNTPIDAGADERP